MNDNFFWIVLDLNLESEMHTVEFNQTVAI